MVAGTMRSLRSHRQKVGRFDWPILTSLFMQNMMLAPLDDEIKRVDKLVKEGTGLLKSWVHIGLDAVTAEKELRNLVQDENALTTLGIDSSVMAKIIAQSNRTPTSTTSNTPSSNHEKTLIDISVVRFPTANDQVFKIYNLKLSMWFQTKRVAILPVSTSGIVGSEFTSSGI
ncbi:hypothetical protein C8Q76DRAFT_707005 [Earliella scabrosa]|nr:hypothetical protein C8Q76DRAFT_707005 [Earliella scabrosa]